VNDVTQSTYSISANRKLTEPAILLRLVDVKNKQFKDEILISIEQEMNDEEYQRRASVELNKCFLDLDFDQNLRIFRKEPEPPVELLASRVVGEVNCFNRDLPNTGACEQVRRTPARSAPQERMPSSGPNGCPMETKSH
jgi:hypothetical protein